jgi:hypothetical protein
MKALFTLILILNISLLLQASNDNVDKYTTWLGVKMYLTSNGLHYGIKDVNKDNIFKKFDAKYPIAMGVQGTVANISLGYTFGATQQWFNDAQTLKNKSNYWGLDFNYMGNKLIFENQISHFDKFEVTNNCNCTQDLVAAVNSFNTTYVDPLLNSFEYSSNLQYVFNGNNWSYKAMLNNGARQTKSSGSLIAMLDYNYHNLQSASDYVIHQTTSGSNFDAYNLTQKIRSSTPSLSIGYGYTMAWRKFYVGGIAYAGSGWLFNKVKVLNSNSFDNTYSFTGRIKANAGYNGKRIYFGIASNFIGINNTIKSELKTNWLNYEYNFYVGVRLATRKLL